MKKITILLSILFVSTPSYAESNNGDTIFDYLFYFLFFASLAINLLFILKPMKIAKSKKNDNESSKDWDITISQQSARIKDLEEEKNELNGSIKKLKDQLSNESVTVNMSIQNKPFDDERPTIVEFEPEQTLKTIYLPSPFDENRFSKEDSKETPTPTSLYVINYDTIKNKGDINLIEDANFDRAINSPHDYFEKVCIYDNPPDVNATKVKVTLKGEVELDGEDWLVTKKLRIKFI